MIVIPDIYAGGLIFNPYLNLEKRIQGAAKGLEAVFTEMDHALDKGHGIRKAVNGDRIGSSIRQHLAFARMEGFQHASKHSKQAMPVLYGQKVGKASRLRADKVNGWMNDFTVKTLKLTPDSQHILSSERAHRAAQYEVGRAYFRGVRDGYRGTDYRKKWITGEEGNTCDVCLLNEDEGRIPVDAQWDSGDDFPPSHLNCDCWVVITR